MDSVGSVFPVSLLWLYGVSLNAILQSLAFFLAAPLTGTWGLLTRLGGLVSKSPRSAWPCLLSSGITATHPHAFLVGAADETQVATLVQQALSWLNNLPQALKKMLIKFYISLCQVCKRSLYILHNSSLSDLSFANRFFQSVSCLLILLVVLFGEVLNLKQFHLTIRFFQRPYLKSPHQSPNPSESPWVLY